jgi:hypothetical protein
VPSALGELNFDIIYWAGIKNADGMCRYPYEEVQQIGTDMVKIDIVKTICSSIFFPPYIETLPTSRINIIEATESPQIPMAHIEMREIDKIKDKMKQFRGSGEL